MAMRTQREADVRATSLRTGLDGGEIATLAGAVVVSAGCYLAFGQPYLARGVVGDVLGFVVLGVPLLARGERGRHEALVCLAGIALVHLIGPTWPLRYPSSVWWACFAIALGCYLLLRARLLGPAGGRRRIRPDMGRRVR